MSLDTIPVQAVFHLWQRPFRRGREAHLSSARHGWNTDNFSGLAAATYSDTGSLANDTRSISLSFRMMT